MSLDKRRRAVLTSIGAASTASLTGCAGTGSQEAGSDSGDGGSGNDDTGSDKKTTTTIEYPSKDIKSIVPYATGGGFDAYSRLAAPVWEEHLGAENVIVNNVVGGGGASGGTQVYTAEPDGHTIMLWQANDSMLVQVARNVGYDLREMTKIGALTKEPAALVVEKGLGLETWEDFTNSINKLNFATQGAGTMAHLGVAFIGEITGAFTQKQANFVHYGGTGEVLAGLQRGEANAFLITSPSSAVKTVQGIEEVELFMSFSKPDSIQGYFEKHDTKPTLYSSEAGINQVKKVNETVHMSRFYLGPPDVPDQILAEQRSAFQKIIEDKEFKKKASDAFRPVLNPDDHKYVEDVVQKTHDKWSSEPYYPIIKEVIG